MSKTVTVNQARFFRNGFNWYCKHDICKTLQVEKPASKAGKEAWTAFYESFAAHLNDVVGAEAVNATLDYFGKQKKRAKLETALGKAGLQQAKAKAAPKAKPDQAAPAADAKAILATAFAAGEISIEDFTTAIAALESSSPAKTVEAVEVVEPIDLDAEGSTDLPF